MAYARPRKASFSLPKDAHGQDLKPHVSAAKSVNPSVTTKPPPRPRRPSLEHNVVMLDGHGVGPQAVAFTDAMHSHPGVAAAPDIASRRTWEDNKDEDWKTAQQKRMQHERNEAAAETSKAKETTKFQAAKAKALAAASNNLFGKTRQHNGDSFSAKMTASDDQKTKVTRAKEKAAKEYYSGKDSQEQNKKFKLRRESSVMMMKEQYAAMPLEEIVDQIQNKIWQRSHSDKDVVRKLIQLLRKSDLTGNGAIGPAEFHYVVRKFFGFDLSPRQTDTLFKSLNKSGTGELHLVEFVQALAGHGMGTFQNHEENEDGTRGRADTMIEKGSMLDHLIDDGKDAHLRVDDHRKDEERFQLAPLPAKMIAQQVIDTIAQKQWERCHSDHDVVRKMVGQLRHWDIDTDGEITEQECRDIVSQNYGFDLTDEQSKAFFSIMDENGDGTISKMEFIRGLSSGDLGEKYSEPIYESRPTVDYKIRSIADTEKARSFQGAPNVAQFQWEGEVMADDADIFSRRITDDAARKVNDNKERLAKSHQRNTQKPYTNNPAKILAMIKEKIWQRAPTDKDVVRKCVWAMRLADESGEGNISESEFAEYIRKFFGFHLTTEQSQILFRHLDVDDSGELTRREFICGLSGRGKILSEQQSDMRRKATRARALNLANAQDPNRGGYQDDFATIANPGSRRTTKERSKIDALKDEQSRQAANSDFEELKGYTRETEAVIGTMRSHIRSRCKTDRELTLRVTRAVRHHDTNDDGTVNVDELRAMLAEEFNYEISDDAADEVMDALTGGTGEDVITKEQMVAILTNKVGHGITSDRAYYAGNEENNAAAGNGRPPSAASTVGTCQSGEFPEGYLAGRFEDERFPYAKEDPGRPASARDRQKAGPHQEPPQRIRTISGVKEVLTQLREKVQFICGSDRAVALHVTRNFRKYDTDGDGLLQAADMRHMLRDEFNFDLNMEQLRQLFNDIDQAGKGTVDKEEFVRVLTGKKGHGKRPLPLVPNFNAAAGTTTREQPVRGSHRLNMHYRGDAEGSGLRHGATGGGRSGNDRMQEAERLAREMEEEEHRADDEHNQKQMEQELLGREQQLLEKERALMQQKHAMMQRQMAAEVNRFNSVQTNGSHGHGTKHHIPGDVGGQQQVQQQQLQQLQQQLEDERGMMQRQQELMVEQMEGERSMMQRQYERGVQQLQEDREMMGVRNGAEDEQYEDVPEDDDDEDYDEEEYRQQQPSGRPQSGRRTGAGGGFVRGRPVPGGGRPSSAISSTSTSNGRPASASSGRRTFARTGLGSYVAQQQGAAELGSFQPSRPNSASSSRPSSASASSRRKIRPPPGGARRKFQQTKQKRPTSGVSWSSNQSDGGSQAGLGGLGVLGLGMKAPSRGRIKRPAGGPVHGDPSGGRGMSALPPALSVAAGSSAANDPTAPPFFAHFPTC
jgi:Ca2+-binding EF-hand superfamily protein